MTLYTTRDAAEASGVPEARVRSFVRTGLLQPERGPRGEYRFTFQDIVVLRTSKELEQAPIGARKVRRALRLLQERLPSGRPLSAVRVAAAGDSVVVRDEESVWDPESGQVHFDFAVADVAREASPIAERMVESEATALDLDARKWFDLGYDLEAVAAREAREAYRKAIALDPNYADAHANLGRMLHEEGRIEDAEAHYRHALEAEPDNATAAFNLGVALEDLGRGELAIRAYRVAVRIDATFAAAHFNLSRLLEESGEREEAIGHLADYKRLVDEP